MGKIIQVKDIPKNYKCIYKLNYPNGKIYVGRSYDLKRRMYEHNNCKKAKAPCDYAIRKYGKITEVEILQEITLQDNIFEEEQYWIWLLHSNQRDVGYNLTVGGVDSGLTDEDNFHSCFTNAEVYDIRKRKYLKERKREVYKDYSHHNFQGFSKLWEGRGYPNVGQEFLCKTDYSVYSGENNKRSKLTEEQVIQIRKMYKEGSRQVDILKLFPDVPKTTLNHLLRKHSWKHVEDNSDYEWKKRKGYFTDEEKIAIKTDIVKGLTNKELENKYPLLTSSHINSIRRGEHWTDIKVDNWQNKKQKHILTFEEYTAIKDKIAMGNTMQEIRTIFPFVSEPIIYRIRNNTYNRFQKKNNN